MPLHRLLLLFIAVPLFELVLLLWISQYTGWRFTLALVLATGFVGAWLTRRQGFRVWDTIQRELHQGRVPAAALFDGMMIFLAGALLITPGILTDLVGFFLLIPPGRRWLRGRLIRRLRAQFDMHATRTHSTYTPRDEVIDVEFVGREEDGT